MRYFVAYHNADRMGYPRPQTLSVLTSRTLKDLEGDVVWIIAGEGGRAKSYSLAVVFHVEQIEKSEVAQFKYEIRGRDGKLFDPPIPLDEEPWFPELLKSQQNFSFGFREIKDDACLESLKNLTRRAGFPVE